MKFKAISYSDLGSREKENYNFQKVSGILADYGFSTIRLSSDWQGADFIAQHVDGSVLRVQLKGRMVFRKEYRNKDLWICFLSTGGIYLFPHDHLLDRTLTENRIMHGTTSWESRGRYSFPRIAQWMKPLLQEYFLPQLAPPASGNL